MSDIWEYIDGCEDYVINTKGEILNTVRSKYLYGSDNGNGYLRVELQHDYGIRREYIHRLVAETFMADYDPDCRIRHVNGQRDDNRLSNLEVVYRGEPSLRGPSRSDAKLVRVRKMGAGGGIIYRSAYQAAAYMGLNPRPIYRVLNSQRATHKGYVFEWVDREDIVEALGGY